MSDSPVIVVGAGLVGSALALALAGRGESVRVVEKRSDPRVVPPPPGRSVNIVISRRGWSLLERIGREPAVREICQPLSGRTLHLADGKKTLQPYSRSGETIYCVERSRLNRCFLDFLAAESAIDIDFDSPVIGVDPGRGQIEIDRGKGSSEFLDGSAIFAADGVFSQVRESLLHRRLDCSQEYLPTSYKEIAIPQGSGLGGDTFHVWPRGRLFFGAFPNRDGSLTGSLFLPQEGFPSFASVDSEEQVRRLFEAFFPEVAAAVPDLEKQFFDHPISPLVRVRCRPWVHEGRVALIGDAAHAVFPFLGQGMNCGFEDVEELLEELEVPGSSWQGTLERWQARRMPNADAISALSLEHFHFLSHSRPDPDAKLRSEVTEALWKRFPDRFGPLYEMLAFTTISYATVEELHRREEEIVSGAVESANFGKKWASGDRDQLLDEVLESRSRR